MSCHTQDSKRYEGKEIMLRISEIECEFLAEVIANGIQFCFADGPLTGPVLDPFLISTIVSEESTLLNLES